MSNQVSFNGFEKPRQRRGFGYGLDSLDPYIIGVGVGAGVLVVTLRDDCEYEDKPIFRRFQRDVFQTIEPSVSSQILFRISTSIVKILVTSRATFIDGKIHRGFQEGTSAANIQKRTGLGLSQYFINSYSKASKYTVNVDKALREGKLIRLAPGQVCPRPYRSFVDGIEYCTTPFTETGAEINIPNIGEQTNRFPIGHAPQLTIAQNPVVWITKWLVSAGKKSAWRHTILPQYVHFLDDRNYIVYRSSSLLSLQMFLNTSTN